MAAKHKINLPGSFYKKHWLILEDGGSDKWLYVTKGGRWPQDFLSGTYFFLEIIDLVGYCGKDAQDRWAASVNVVKMDELQSATISAILSSCGAELPLLEEEAGRLELAQMANSHGAYAPLWSKCGGLITDPFDNLDENCVHFRKLRKEAREYCETSLFDEKEFLDIWRNKIVNSMGQTAQEYASGSEGLWSTLRRIQLEGGTKEQEIILRMYQFAETTLGSGPIPEDICLGKKESGLSST